MNEYRLHIKNMVCPRCIAAVRNLLEEMHLPFASVTLGEALLQQAPAPEEKQQLEKRLRELGFELLDDRNGRLISRIKTAVIEWVHYGEERSYENLSEYLRRSLGMDYRTLSRLFSETEGITVERYAIAQKTERIKEWLVYGELSLKEIAFRMGYSSTAHLSAQFKKETGLTPGHYRRLRDKKRKSLDEI